MTTPIHPDDLPDGSDSELDALFSKPACGRKSQPAENHSARVLHSDSERETLAQSVFEIHRGDLLDEKARELIRFMDALKSLEEHAVEMESGAKGQRGARLKKDVAMYQRARDLWNSETALFLMELRLDLAALLENEYGKSACWLVNLLRDNELPPHTRAG